MKFSYKPSEDKKSLILSTDYDGQLYEIVTTPPDFKINVCLHHIFNQNWGVTAMEELPTGFIIAIDQELKRVKLAYETKNSKPPVKPASNPGASPKQVSAVTASSPAGNYRRLTTSIK